jgi:hypothetical protein
MELLGGWVGWHMFSRVRGRRARWGVFGVCYEEGKGFVSGTCGMNGCGRWQRVATSVLSNCYNVDVCMFEMCTIVCCYRLLAVLSDPSYRWMISMYLHRNPHAAETRYAL